MSTVYNAPVSTEAAEILGTATKPTAKATAAKVIARAKAKAPATKPSTKDIDAKIDAALGHKAKGNKPAPAKAPAKAVKVAKSRTGIERKFTVKNGTRKEVWGRSKEFLARKPFGTYDEAFCAKVRAFIKEGHTFMDAKRVFGCSAHWAARMFRSSK